MKKKTDTETETIRKMVGIYCRAKHCDGKKLCPDCSELLVYAEERARRCPHEPKPACKDCKTHCYTPERRKQIKEVMRFAGPRMPLRHPLLTLRHYLGK